MLSKVARFYSFFLSFFKLNHCWPLKMKFVFSNNFIGFWCTAIQGLEVWISNRTFTQLKCIGFIRLFHYHILSQRTMVEIIYSHTSLQCSVYFSINKVECFGVTPVEFRVILFQIYLVEYSSQVPLPSFCTYIRASTM